MRPVDESEGMGILQAVLDAEARRGNRAKTLTRERQLHGDKPRATLNHQLDRDVVEAEFDIGTLIEWWKPNRQTWSMCDTATGTSINGGVWSPFGALRNRWSRAPERRQRLGWVSDDPGLAWGTDAETTRTVQVTTSIPASKALARLEEVLGSDSELPGWFAEQCARPESRWPVERWQRSMLPTERTWRWSTADATGPNELSVTVEVPTGWAPIGSLEWLLEATAGTTAR